MIFFNGNRPDYRTHRISVLTCARSASIAACPRGLGLLGLLVSPSEFTQICEDNGLDTTLYEPVPTSGPMPVTAVAFRRWEYIEKKFTAVALDINAFQSKYVASLGPDIIRLIGEPRSGILNLSLSQILSELDLRFLEYTTLDVTNNRLNLAIPFRPTDQIELYYKAHQAYHQLAHDAANTISSHEKFNYFTKGTMGSSRLRQRLQLFELVHPVINSESFDRLAMAFIEVQAHHDLADDGPTSAGAYAATPTGLALPSAASVLSTSLSTHMEDLKLQIAALTLLQAQAKPPRPPKELKPGYYCWTHGLGGHGTGGMPCNSPAPGHVSKATWKDKHGGSVKIWHGFKA